MRIRKNYCPLSTVSPTPRYCGQAVESKQGKSAGDKARSVIDIDSLWHCIAGEYSLMVLA
jgi:hypothetical protein